MTVLCAKGGVEPQTETVWRQADEYKVPRMIYVNKMDIMGADFFRVLDMIHERLKCNAVPIQLPIGSETFFKGNVDLLTMKANVFYDELGKDVRVEDIPEDMVDICEEYHEKLMDAVTALDDDLAMMYLEGEEIPVEKIKAVIRRATIANEMVPIVCGTSYKNKGVQELLDAVVDYMPSPLDKKGIRGINPDTEEEDFPSRFRRRTLLRSGLQDRYRPLRGQAVLLPCVLRYAGEGHHRAELHQGRQRAYGPYPADARQSPRDMTSLRRRHRRRGRRQEHHHRRHLLRRRITP